MSQDTRDLVDQASNGDPVAIDTLLLRYLPSLTAYLRLHAGPLVTARESCADLAQSVCREALAGMHNFEFRGEAPFRKWLCQLAMRKIYARQRQILSAKRNPGYEEQRASQVGATYAAFCSPSEVAMGKEELEQVALAFERLPQDYRDVITKSRIFGMSHAEIATDMRRKEGAVRILLHRALVRLAWFINHPIE